MIVAAIEHDVALIGAVGSVVVACVTGILMLAGKWLDARHTNRIDAYQAQNSKEHQRSMSVLREIQTDVGGIKADVVGIKIDVASIKSEILELDDRVDDLEADRE